MTPNTSFSYDDATRRRVLNAVARRGFLAPVALATGISIETLRRWAAKAGIGLPPGRERIARTLGFRSAASITHILAQRETI
jgi:DNA-binding phage protein